MEIPRALHDSCRRFRDWLSSCSVTCLNVMSAKDEIGMRAQRTKRVNIRRATLLLRSVGCSLLDFNVICACLPSSDWPGQPDARDLKSGLGPFLTVNG